MIVPWYFRIYYPFPFYLDVKNLFSPVNLNFFYVLIYWIFYLLQKINIKEYLKIIFKFTRSSHFNLLHPEDYLEIISILFLEIIPICFLI